MPDVRRVTATALPDYRIDSVTLLGEGTDNTAYEINGELIVRFSKAPDPERTMREARLLDTVRRVASLPVPEPVFTVPEQGCLAYRKLPGTPLLDLPAPPHPERIAATLTEFLAALHETPRDQVAELVETDDQPLTEWLAETTELHRAVAGLVPPPYRQRVEAFLGTMPPPDGSTLVFSHNDLGIEHVLADPRTWAVTGIIDWSDAALADPACDFGLLFRDLGPAALPLRQGGSRIAAPGEPPDATQALRERAVFYARCGMLEDLAYGVETGQRRYTDKSLAALEWLFPRDGGRPERVRRPGDAVAAPGPPGPGIGSPAFSDEQPEGGGR
jgi:aminoglycoside phosphotransferase (APT) family kinase protein